MQQKLKCRCVRCKNEHMCTERIDIPSKEGMVAACPRCLAYSYYDITEYDFDACKGRFLYEKCPKRDTCLLFAEYCNHEEKQSSLYKLQVWHYKKITYKNCKYHKKATNK